MASRQSPNLTYINTFSPPLSARRSIVCWAVQCYVVRGVVPSVATAKHRSLRDEPQRSTAGLCLIVPQRVGVRKRCSVDCVARDVGLRLPSNAYSTLWVVENSGGFGVGSLDCTVLANLSLVSDSAVAVDGSANSTASSTEPAVSGAALLGAFRTTDLSSSNVALIER